MDNLGMNTYKRHRFPPDIISYAVRLYYRFNLSHRDIEDLLAQKFLTAHAAVYNLFNMGRHLIRAQHYRDLRVSAFNEWSRTVL
jgi:transposase-like protein